MSTAKPEPRVLACVLCQRRKVKCDRKFPCANCVAAGAQCVPATLAPRRRRRFPDGVLLERLRHYEGLLRQNNINFEPLHPPATAAEHASASENRRGLGSLDDAHSEGSRESREKTAVKSEAVDLWHAISRVTLEPEDNDDKGDGDGDGDGDDTDGGFLHTNHRVRDAVENVWDHADQSEGNDQGNDHLLFGPPQANVHLSTLHPEQVQIFRLWQIYLENVNPLLKVTHTPTLQARIIDAVSDIANISPTLEALIFSIYCVSVTSLAEDKCRILFGSPRKDLLAGYQFACQQALLKCRAWRFTDVDGLTALYLYLVSVRPQIEPRSLSSMLAVAIRIAQRMGMHNESTYVRYTPLEAEIRRRLWWSLIIFDHRNCEMSDYKITMLTPTWDCRTPLNVDDFEIQPEIKTSPVSHKKPTEAFFAVVRSELADFVRHSAFHLNFINPSLSTIAQPKNTWHGPVPEGGELMALEKTIEDKYLALCDPANPLHFMTIWTMRGYLARNRLLEHYSRHSTSSVQQTDAQRNAAISYALRMLECDTKLRTSPLTKGYLWLVDFYVPALANIHILNNLKKRPTEDHAEKAWDAMSDNYEARAMHPKPDGQSIFAVFARVVLQAWGAREAILRQQNKPLEPPRMVSHIRNKLMQMSSSTFSQNTNGDQPNGAVGINIDESPMPTAMGFGGHGIEGQCFTGPGPGGYPDIPGQAIMDVDMDQFWTTMDWRLMHTQGW